MVRHTFSLFRFSVLNEKRVPYHCLVFHHENFYEVDSEKDELFFFLNLRIFVSKLQLKRSLF